MSSSKQSPTFQTKHHFTSVIYRWREVAMLKKKKNTAKRHSWLPFTWREVDEGNTLMAEPLNLLELLAAPQRNTTLVEGGQIGAFRRPAHVRLCPALHWDAKTLQVEQANRSGLITSIWPCISKSDRRLTALSSAMMGSLASLLKMAVLSPAS